MVGAMFIAVSRWFEVDLEANEVEAEDWLEPDLFARREPAPVADSFRRRGRLCRSSREPATALH
jgi:hypothetical protein